MKDSKTDIGSKESDDQRNTSSGGGDDEEEGADGNDDYDEDDDDAQFDLISSKGNLVEFLNDPVADRNENKDTMTPDSQLSFMEFRTSNADVKSVHNNEDDDADEDLLMI